MAYADSLRGMINPGKATSSASLGAGAEQHESTNTTHYSIIDRWGNAVALTYTINNNMGAKVIAGKTGYLLNDEMDDFTAKPGSPNIWGLVQGKANAVAPGKRPLSSMAPTIVLKDGNPVLVLGAPGGARRLTTVLEILVAVIDHQIPLQEAVDAPRYHHQWQPDTLQVEPGALQADVITALEAMGHAVVPLERWTVGNSASVIGVLDNHVLLGVSDVRTPAGSAAAP